MYKMGFTVSKAEERIGRKMMKLTDIEPIKFTRRFRSSYVGRESIIMHDLGNIVEPYTHKSIVGLGLVQSMKIDDESRVHINMDYIVPGYPNQTEIERDILAVLDKYDWIKGVHLKSHVPKKNGALNSSTIDPTVLSSVGHIIGVSSCKGGVGKSTVAANIAVCLAQQGLHVGLLDADVYGPSLPYLIPAESNTVRRSTRNSKQILPLQSLHQPNLKILSFGHVNPKSGAPGSGGQAAAVVRGPIASRIINQLLLQTEWGDLDYLVVDMPPGTGDIQITLSQSACLSGVVLVTTPHPLSLADAAKGVATMIPDTVVV
mmetsp:Transcript_32328/g.54497  ORF Transcript_32328/g.54497 Transcript_32328/m.54497 type:complete len:317 (+) Transcript_32328:34-984(+)